MQFLILMYSKGEKKGGCHENMAKCDRVCQSGALIMMMMMIGCVVNWNHSSYYLLGLAATAAPALPFRPLKPRIPLLSLRVPLGSRPRRESVVAPASPRHRQLVGGGD